MQKYRRFDIINKIGVLYEYKTNGEISGLKKTVLKTILYTLLSVLAALMILFSVMTLFAPGTLADFNFSLGNKNLCVWYTEKEYENRKSVDTLNKLVYRTKWLGDDKRIAKYSKLLIDDQGFDSLCKRTDKENEGNGKIKGSYKDYIYSDYVLALYRLNADKEAIAFAANQVMNGAYPVNNAFQALLYSVYLSKDYQTLKGMVGELDMYIANITSEEDKLRAENDLKYFGSLGEENNQETNTKE